MRKEFIFLAEIRRWSITHIRITVLLISDDH